MIFVYCERMILIGFHLVNIKAALTLKVLMLQSIIAKYYIDHIKIKFKQKMQVCNITVS